MNAPKVDILLAADWAASGLVQDVRRGLGSQPRTLPPKWLYDEAGSRLFDEITRLPEYYPTECERTILREAAAEIAATSHATTVVELGSGTSDKTRLLLDAYADAGHLERFVPVDVSEETLREAADMLAARYPTTSVEAVVGDFTLHLGHLARYGRKLIAFLGGTIGNLYVEERAAFLGALADSMADDDELLLGTDLVKEADRLITAYDDPGGVTEAFVKNSLHVLNRELGADFDPDAFSYVPFWDRRMQRMDLRLRAEMPQHVALPGAGIELDLASGEEIRVEISTKFTPEGLRKELEAVGLRVARTWTDPTDSFAVTLARKTS
ncbi:L-histidine N(alpha)-methyltransferase [Nocardioides silvaticus]|uniref:L-histidine N(Alpha)-methyltransferase n=1 Tax=Nocardioides silvaticus TaxID=2201891 RepID=A0A316TPP9_9ACTN|nr:L-histidine N(alpha)-methyltransferase [Nocardioides silvaticus]PWN04174.1 L-histidine N(alpha)-methyltransferase [Nocardioides silvaticus]